MVKELKAVEEAQKRTQRKNGQEALPHSIVSARNNLPIVVLLNVACFLISCLCPSNVTSFVA